MNEIYEYNTLATEAQGRFQSRGSKFIATLLPMADVSTLDSWISSSRKEHPKARHHCYAYRILNGKEVMEFASDDGEPSGSAGRPILGQLRSAELINVGCVVIRYFGGTKLGVPGLIEAYGTAASEAATASEIRKVVRTNTYTLSAPIALQPHMHRAAKQGKLQISNEQYSSHRFDCTINVPMKTSDESILNFLRALSHRDYGTWHEHANFLSIEIDDPKT